MKLRNMDEHHVPHISLSWLELRLQPTKSIQNYDCVKRYWQQDKANELQKAV